MTSTIQSSGVLTQALKPIIRSGIHVSTELSQWERCAIVTRIFMFAQQQQNAVKEAFEDIEGVSIEDVREWILYGFETSPNPPRAVALLLQQFPDEKGWGKKRYRNHPPPYSRFETIVRHALDELATHKGDEIWQAIQNMKAKREFQSFDTFMQGIYSASPGGCVRRIAHPWSDGELEYLQQQLGQLNSDKAVRKAYRKWAKIRSLKPRTVMAINEEIRKLKNELFGFSKRLCQRKGPHPDTASASRSHLESALSIHPLVRLPTGLGDHTPQPQIEPPFALQPFALPPRPSWAISREDIEAVELLMGLSQQRQEEHADKGG